MGNEKMEHINRVLPLVLASGEAVIDFQMTWNLPGHVSEYNEPELTVMQAEAKALENQVCVHFTINQETFYVVAETGLVEKASTTHQETRLIPVDNVKPGDLVQVDVEANIRGNWQTKKSDNKTEFAGTCGVTVNYMVQKEQEVILYKADNLDGAAMAQTLNVETIQAQFAQTVDLAIVSDFAQEPVKVGKISGELINIKATSLFAWVKVEGEAVVEIPYQTAAGASVVETVVYPVKHYFEVADARPEMEVSPEATVEIFTCEFENDSQVGMLRGLLHLRGRLVCIETLDITAQMRSHQSFYHHDKHHPHLPAQYYLEQVVATGSSQTLIQREIIFIRPARKVREPVDAQVRNLRHEIIPNKVIVRGVLHKQIMAVERDTGVVFAQDVRESFVHFVDVPGAHPGMRAHVDARVEFVKVDIHPGGETARQVTIIEIRVKVTRPVKKEIPGPKKPPHHHKPTPVKPTQKVYTVRSGDTVWKIANMFGVSMEAIIRANNLQNPNLIFPGQQLIIPL